MITFFTDPHIGLRRVTNTTPKSRLILRDAGYHEARDILEGANHKGLVCLGDLFDNYTNNELDLLRGREIAQSCDLVIGGNHDMTPDVSTFNSLELIKQTIDLDRTAIVQPASSQLFLDPVVELHLNKETRAAMVAIPHHSTQSMFEQALEKAQLMDIKGKTGAGWVRFLLLHCNYESPHELTETSLNLTREWAERLLTKYNYIMLGHEHQPRDLMNGRLVILGNIHPTGFSDISDKRIAKFNNGELRFEQVWSMSDGYLEVDCQDIPEENIDPVQFVRITGEAQHGQLAHIAKSVGKLWRSNPAMLAVKSSVEVHRTKETARSHSEMRSLPQLIEYELASDPPMLGMWKEATK
jgi:DNA repair exonuclease SbcCD nuclease subunit